MPEPASRAGHRRGVPCRRLLRRPRRGAGQVRDGAPRPRGRRAGDRDRGGVRVLPAAVLPGRCRPGGIRAGGAGAGQARAPRGSQAHRADPGLGRTAAGGRSRPEARRWPGLSQEFRGARAPPLRRASAGPPAGAHPKAADLPAPERGKEENPSLSLRPSPGPAAAEPGPSPPGPDAGQVMLPAAGWTPATSSCVMPPCTHARARSRSGPACSPARASPPGGGPWPT